ncbi:MAG: hypothetical protein MUE82_12630 [Chloroflexi bacterium]|nr:hypothetical protein [Chloroflexota bacterium]
MTDIDAIKERHVPDYPPSYKAHEGPCCAHDRFPWPCDTARETERADKAEAALAALEEAFPYAARTMHERDAAREDAERLARYARHANLCDYARTSCTCGFREVLAAHDALVKP